MLHGSVLDEALQVCVLVKEGLWALESADTDQLQTLVARASRLHNLLLQAIRHDAASIARARIERDSVKLEMHAELVDREANSARVADRQRLLFERSAAQPGQASAGERAVQSAAYVEAALASLCPHGAAVSVGCEQLV